MMIDARGLDYQALNAYVRDAQPKSVIIDNCLGQRYIGSGLVAPEITINGVPGNALGAYMGGGRIEVHASAQDATGDTMSGGEIVIHGRSGDATGYAMRGGRIFVRGDVGDRIGVHMKAYKELRPVIVAGGRAGRFLGEYQAGGLIVILNIDQRELPCAGRYVGTGMHGGRIYLRTEKPLKGLPAQVSDRAATPEDIAIIRDDVTAFAQAFMLNAEEILEHPFRVLTPNADNPYHQMYTPV